MILDDKSIRLFLIIVIGLAFIGFFVGTAPTAPKAGLSQFRSTEGEPLLGEPARSYGDLMQRPLASNPHWLKSIDELRAQSTPARTDAVPPQDPAARAASLAARATRRAHAGAPPVVPHAVTQSDDLACRACHDGGLRVAGRTASAMSHDMLVNCTQCHVSDASPVPGAAPAASVSTENSFMGLAEPPAGERAMDGAPPMIPHQTHMRETCMSCHGPHGANGLKTTHPERQSCTQCHAPSAEYDQRAVLPGLRPVGTP